METYHYTSLSDYLKVENKNKHSSWTPLFRQLLIVSGTWTALFISGLGMGSSTIVIAQWRKEANSDTAIDEEMSSWITCGAYYSALGWSFVYMSLAKSVGRKTSLGLSFVFVLLSYIIFYYSTTTSHLMISEILKGSGYATNLSVTILIITEYSSPKYRGIFLTIKAASVFWGIWVANAIGTFLHWRYIAICAFVCYIHVALTVFWPESPLWLATKGRFDECARTHRWLKGTDDESERELRNLIATQKENLKKTPVKTTMSVQLTDFFKSISKRHFYMPLFVSTLISLQIILSGKLSCALYALELIKKMTKDESKTYTIMLILDGFTIIGMYFGCGISRYVKRRKHAIFTSIITCIFLYAISLYFLLVDLNLVKENYILMIVLLTVYSVSVACGPLILAYTLYGELIPTESRTLYALIGVLLNLSISATYLKTAPYVFNRLSMQLTFLIYAVSATAVTIFMYVFLPETKEKTLSEIENYFKRPKSVELPVANRVHVLNSVE